MEVALQQIFIYKHDARFDVHESKDKVLRPVTC